MPEADLGDIAEDRSLHDFEVLLVLGGGAGGDLVEPFAGVGSIDAAEAAEGGEELVVTADAGAGHEAAHGEGVDESIVELLVFEGVLGADIAFATDGLRREAPGGGCGFEEAHRFGIDAEEIGGGVLDEGFGVDGAGEMHVKVGTLGHASEESGEFEWALPGGVEGADGALLARGCCRGCLCRGPRCGTAPLRRSGVCASARAVET